MDQRTNELLDAFTQRARKNQLRAEDWQRFFDLAVHVHLHRVFMTGQEVRLRLADAGFSTAESSRLGADFELFGQLLRRYDELKTWNMKL
jgi:hypothetical protein